MMDMTIDKINKDLLKAGPKALELAKRLVHDVAGRPIDDTLREETARLIAEVSSGEEGHEGIRAFLEKRPPEWPAD